MGIELGREGLQHREVPLAARRGEAAPDRAGATQLIDAGDSFAKLRQVVGAADLDGQDRGIYLGETQVVRARLDHHPVEDVERLLRLADRVVRGGPGDAPLEIVLEPIDGLGPRGPCQYRDRLVPSVLVDEDLHEDGLGPAADVVGIVDRCGLDTHGGVEECALRVGGEQPEHAPQRVPEPRHAAVPGTRSAVDAQRLPRTIEVETSDECQDVMLACGVQVCGTDPSGHGLEEVEGTMGHAPERTTLVNGPADVATLVVTDPDNLVWLSQTTLSVDETMETVRLLRERFPALHNPPSDDICYATQNRQVAIKKVAESAELVIVVGSANSSNTVRLVDVALENGAKTAHRVDYASEIQQEWLDGVATVGVTSGASVPEVLVQEVLDDLADAGYTDVRHVVTAEEDLMFSLPKELRTDANGKDDARGLGGRTRQLDWQQK